MHRDKNTFKYITATVLLLAFLRNRHVPSGMDIVIGNCQPPMYLDYFIHFLATDIILFAWAIYAALNERSILSYVLVILGAGLIVREFVTPFGIDWTDYVFQSLAAIVAFVVYAKRNLYDHVTTGKYFRQKT